MLGNQINNARTMRAQRGGLCAFLEAVNFGTETIFNPWRSNKVEAKVSATNMTDQSKQNSNAKPAVQNGAAVPLDAKKTAAAAKQKPTVSHMLGEVTWLLSQSPAHKHFAIGDLEWMVMPAILLEQFRVFHGEKTPVGFALWAHLSEEAEARLTSAVAAGSGARLRPDDWRSGDRLWLIEIVAPFATPENKLQEAMVADLIQNVFKDKKFKFHAADPATGKREVRELGG